MPGPSPVGVATLTLPAGNAVEVWYPAAAPVTGEVSYDMRDFVPDGVKALLTADIPAGVSYPGQRDVAVADGRHPLVLFSHGFAGVRVQSSLITSHLASYGMIVAAPDHPSRDLNRVLSNPAPGDRSESVTDLLATLDLLTAEDGASGGRFAGHVDLERVGLMGHSAGGFTVITAALDPRVDGYVSMASGGPPEGQAYPTVPSLWMAGADDAVVPAATVTRPAFDAAPSPSWYAELAETGHNGFDDFCTFGGGTGIIGVAEASGLGPLLESSPQLRTLGEDGCVPPAAPVERSLPVIRHTTVAFLQYVFGESEAPVFDFPRSSTVAFTVVAH